MDKRFMAILGGLIVIFGAFFVISQNSSNNKDKSSDQTSSSQATNHVMGEASSKVTLVEYGDFQCPVCALYYQPTKDAVEGLKDKIKFQFRNLPIVQIHPNAFAAARAAEAADQQGKYWEMHGILYTNQTKWAGSTSPLEFFKAYAKELGLNMDQFEKDYASAKVNDAINADLDEFAKTNQQQATPTFFINGKVIDNKDLAGSNGFPSVEKFTAIINAELAKN